MVNHSLLVVASLLLSGWIVVGMFFAYKGFVDAGAGLPRLHIYSRPAALFLLAVCATLIFYPLSGLLPADIAINVGFVGVALFSFIGVRGVMKYLVK